MCPCKTTEKSGKYNLTSTKQNKTNEKRGLGND